ncbi:hypothetical protein AB0I28_38375 [Phytomonospora sp. NPDC050363]|uniref:hypothetical protein n=1 Tax=Phytomonospora sp. NPDC050363 TaxID=3155642 RepID=UPI0033F47A01
MKLFRNLSDRIIDRLVGHTSASADIGLNFYRCVPPHLSICGPFTRVRQSCGGTPTNPTGCSSVGCCT